MDNLYSNPLLQLAQKDFKEVAHTIQLLINEKRRKETSTKNLYRWWRQGSTIYGMFTSYLAPTRGSWLVWALESRVCRERIYEDHHTRDFLVVVDL